MTVKGFQRLIGKSDIEITKEEQKYYAHNKFINKFSENQLKKYKGMLLKRIDPTISVPRRRR